MLVPRVDAVDKSGGLRRIFCLVKVKVKLSLCMSRRHMGSVGIESKIRRLIMRLTYI